MSWFSFLKSNAGKPVEVVVKNKEDIRPTIQSTLSNGLELKNGEFVQAENAEWFEKAEAKTHLAVEAYTYYLKHPQSKKK
ncbi:hypothetical protein FACS189428_5720 [Clostridia bacterium]|nr:hypothetical protein FACS189428_5720 [Clostridia bacterium]